MGSQYCLKNPTEFFDLTKQEDEAVNQPFEINREMLTYLFGHRNVNFTAEEFAHKMEDQAEGYRKFDYSSIYPTHNEKLPEKFMPIAENELASNTSEVIFDTAMPTDVFAFMSGEVGIF